MDSVDCHSCEETGITHTGLQHCPNCGATKFNWNFLHIPTNSQGNKQGFFTSRKQFVEIIYLWNRAKDWKYWSDL